MLRSAFLPGLLLVGTLAACGMRPSSNASAALERSVGVATSDSAGLCLRIRNRGLAPGQPLTLFPVDATGGGMRSHVIGPRATPCPGDADANPSDQAYQLADPAGGGIYVAAVGEYPPSRTRAADLDGDREGEHVHTCTSAEGVHVSIWSGAPLAGRLRWHRYVYLGYDTEPSCTPEATVDPAGRLGFAGRWNDASDG